MYSIRDASGEVLGAVLAPISSRQVAIAVFAVGSSAGAVDGALKARPSNPTYRQFAFGPYTPNRRHPRPIRRYACNRQQNAAVRRQLRSV